MARAWALTAALGAVAGLLALPAAADAPVDHRLTGSAIQIGFDPANPERVAAITWTTPTDSHSDYVADGGVTRCVTPAEFFGESLRTAPHRLIHDVGTSSTGTWSNRRAWTTTHSRVADPGCSAETVPVTTSYTMGAGTHANTVHVTRTFSFPDSSTSSESLTPYVVRLPAAFGTLLYPGYDGLVTAPAAALGDIVGWAGDWFAQQAADGHGVLVITGRDDGGPIRGPLAPVPIAEPDALAWSPAYSPAFDGPLPGPGDRSPLPAASWHGSVRFDTFLCFYDDTTWPQALRETSLPAGCGTFVRSAGPVHVRSWTTGHASHDTFGVDVSTARLDPGANAVTACARRGRTRIHSVDDCDARFSYAGAVRPSYRLWSLAAHRTYRFALFPRYEQGGLGAAGPARNSHLMRGTRIRLRDCGRIVYGVPCRFRTTLTDARSGLRMPGADVSLWAYEGEPTPSWSKVASATTDEAGKARVRILVGSRHVYAWRYDGGRAHLASVSGHYHLNVAFHVTAHVTDRDVPAGHQVTVFGTVEPAVPGLTADLHDWYGANHGWSSDPTDPSAHVPVKRQRLPNGRVAFGYVFHVRAAPGRNRHLVSVGDNDDSSDEGAGGGDAYIDGNALVPTFTGH